MNLKEWFDELEALLRAGLPTFLRHPKRVAMGLIHDGGGVFRITIKRKNYKLDKHLFLYLMLQTRTPNARLGLYLNGRKEDYKLIYQQDFEVTPSAQEVALQLFAELVVIERGGGK